MNEGELKQLTREGILCDLHAARPATLPGSTLLQGRRYAGIPLSETALANELHYLEGKGLVEPKRAALSAGAVRYTITAAGVDHLEAEGLA